MKKPKTPEKPGPFYRVLKFVRDHPFEAIPADLQNDLDQLKERAISARETGKREGFQVELSPYILSVLGLKDDGAGITAGVK